MAKFATVQTEGNRAIKREISHYNLDIIISVGYRVNSKEGTRFRIWATKTLHQYLLEGFALNKKRLCEKGVKEYKQIVALLAHTIKNKKIPEDEKIKSTDLILKYTKSWTILSKFDKQELSLPLDLLQKGSNDLFDIENVRKEILVFKIVLLQKKEASDIFGQEKDNGLLGLLEAIKQTFDNQALYSSIEEKAAHLLYFIVKDHPFVDGNKRIGSYLMMLYLAKNSLASQINASSLVTLTLLVAESSPSTKALMINLIINLIHSK